MDRCSGRPDGAPRVQGDRARATKVEINDGPGRVQPRAFVLDGIYVDRRAARNVPGNVAPLPARYPGTTSKHRRKVLVTMPAG
jgi:hypothetical protein